jgi:uncharacterized lipoprotein YddW (UPF0748 family)
MLSIANITPSTVHATWLPVNTPVPSATAMRTILANLTQNGVNRVYVDVWNNGVAYFNSSAVSAVSAAAVSPSDRLRWALDAQSGLEVHAWLEYGLMACHGDVGSNAFAVAVQRRGWLIGASGGWQWLDPSPGSSLLSSMASEIQTRYPGVAGVQLDDHFGCPAPLAACSAAKMDNAARAVSGGGSGLRLSLSPPPAAFALAHFNVGWPQWVEAGLFAGGVAPQLYTANSSTFATELRDAIAAVPSLPRSAFVAGVRVNGRGQTTAWAEVAKMLDLAEASNVGAAVWFTDGVINLFPAQFRARWTKNVFVES